MISHTPPQFRPVGRLVSRPDAEPGKKPLQFISTESFGEDVCTVLCRQAVDNLDLLRHDHLAHKVILNLNVLHLSMEDKVFGNGDVTLVVAIQHCWSLLPYANVSQDVA